MLSNTLIILDPTAMTGTTEIDSKNIQLTNIYTYSIQAVWTGSPNGIINYKQAAMLPLFLFPR